MLNPAILLAASSRPPAQGGGFQPGDIAGLVLWLDADDVATLTLDGSNRVSQWADKSGQGAHAAQPNATYRPTYAPAAINARGAVDFAEDYLELPDLPGITGSANRSAFVAFEHFEAQEQGYLIAFGHFSTGTPGAAWRFAIHGNGNLQVEITGSNYNTALAPGTAAAQGALILNGSTIGDHQVFLDGTGENATGTSVVNTGTGEASISQQNRGGPGGFIPDKAINGYISEVLVYGTAVTDADRQKLEGYLGHKWGLTASLPVGHPYKFVAP